MGLFSRRRDSEVDDLDSSYETQAQSGESAAWQGQTAPVAQPLEMTVQAQQAEQRASYPPKHTPVENYGFEHVAQLMQSLPLNENRDLVVKVFKKTLESVNISLDLVIEDAERRLSEITEQIAQVKQVITDLQQEINTRRKESTDLEAHLAEVAKVKDLLYLAKNTEEKVAAAVENSDEENAVRTTSTFPAAKVSFGPRDSKNPDLSSTKK